MQALFPQPQSTQKQHQGGAQIASIRSILLHKSRGKIQRVFPGKGADDVGTNIGWIEPILAFSGIHERYVPDKLKCCLCQQI